jgi:DNA-binding PadR family transcriptional regulator
VTAEPQPNAHDLSDAFGRPAAASLRGLLPPRRRRDDAPAAEPAPEESGTPSTEDDVDPGSSPATTATTATTAAAEVPASRPSRRGAATPAARAGQATGNRRWGPVRLASPEHVQLLVLVALRHGPADGREIAERLHRDSGGALSAPPTTVQRTVHHLALHGLVESDATTTRRRYRLTEPGRRAVSARIRAWRAMRGAVDAVVRATDEG